MVALDPSEPVTMEVNDPAVLAIEPLVTVLITTYNQQEYLAQAIEGAVGQQVDFPFEIIIGEDCSTDATRAIALDYQKRYPQLLRVVYANRNVGAFRNSNRCFPRARGEFVAYCEGDDYWSDPRKLQKQVDFLRAHPECGMVHSDYDYLVHAFGRWRVIPSINRTKGRSIPTGDIYPALLRTMTIRTCTMMGRRSLLHQHYQSALRSPEHAVGDRPIVLHMSKLALIGYIDQPLATYRRRPGSFINSGHRNLLRMRKMKLAMYRNFAAAFAASEADWLEMQRICYLDILHSAVLAKSREDFEVARQWLVANGQMGGREHRLAVLSLLMRLPPQVLSWALSVKDLKNELYLLLRSRQKAT